MKDWRGTEVEPGDIVVYAVTWGSSLTMVEAEVVEVDVVGKDRWGQDRATVKVRRLREAWGYGEAKPVEPREVKLTVPKRLVVVEKAPSSSTNSSDETPDSTGSTTEEA